MTRGNDLPGTLPHLTFRGNRKTTRYGWLRLTPAYSLHVVSEIVAALRAGSVVLDPFCGTGTTALVCAELGLECSTSDINPFLIWLAKAKTYSYTASDLSQARGAAVNVTKAILREDDSMPWVPPIYQIEKWWDPIHLGALGRAMACIRANADIDGRWADILRLAFCRLMIGCAHVDFGHQSMSFKRQKTSRDLFNSNDPIEKLAEDWKHIIEAILNAARSPILREPKVVECDARDLTIALPRDRFDCVVTSPPYPNRMSYIRELRPYMYWLGYLKDGREAGELDWKAIGGTWGCATSNLSTWEPTKCSSVPSEPLADAVRRVGQKSRVLATYILRYFHDAWEHCRSLKEVVKDGGEVHYVVGNSKFYETMLHVEQIYADLFRAAGFVDVHIELLRKRTSKKELFEYAVHARNGIGG